MVSIIIHVCGTKISSIWSFCNFIISSKSEYVEMSNVKDLRYIILKLLTSILFFETFPEPLFSVLIRIHLLYTIYQYLLIGGMGLYSYQIA